MLDAVAQLAGDLLGNVDRVLRDEIDAHALRTDQAHNLFDLVFERFGRVIEQQVRFVEEEHQPGFVGIAHFGQAFEQFGQQPQQEGGVQLGPAHQLVRGEHVDHAPALVVEREEIVDLQRGFAEEHVRALALEAEQLPLDRPDAGLRHIAVSARKLLRVLVGIGEHGLQVAKVEQQQSIIIGMTEDDVEHTFLRLIEIEQPRQQQRPHFRNGGADREALLAIQIPEHGGIIGIGIIVHAQFRRPRFELVGMFELRRTGHRDTRQIALHIGDEDRDAIGGETFRQPLQRHRLAGARRPGDQTVAIGLVEPQVLVLAISAQSKENLAHCAARSRWFARPCGVAQPCGCGQAIPRQAQRLR